MFLNGKHWLICWLICEIVYQDNENISKNKAAAYTCFPAESHGMDLRLLCLSDFVHWRVLFLSHCWLNWVIKSEYFLKLWMFLYLQVTSMNE